MSDPLHFDDSPEPATQKRMNGCLIAALVFLGLGALGLVAIVAGLIWLGASSPETSIYKGAQVPAGYVETMRELGALEEGEELLYFYSDGMGGIEEGFYFVSDRKVAVYIEGVEEPLLTATFDQIDEAELTRDTSFFIDSQIVLYLDDGDTIWFPVSSEMDRDVVFHQAIVDRIDP